VVTTGDASQLADAPAVDAAPCAICWELAEASAGDASQLAE
jgi:hypothetical protein